MTALFNLPAGEDSLTEIELKRLTGASRTVEQKEWLEKNCYEYTITRKGDLIVTRLYRMMRGLGIEPKSIVSRQEWTPDFGKLS